MQGTYLILCLVIYLELTALFADGHRECRDTFHSCVSWSKAGMCGNNRFGFVMKGGCAKTCGFCEASSDTTSKKNVESSSQNANSKLKTESDENTSSELLVTTATTPTTTPTIPTTPTTRTTTNTPTTPTSGTTQTTHSTQTTQTTPTTQTTHTTHTTPTTQTTQTTPATQTTHTTHTTPTTQTTHTTHTTPTTQTTHTTHTTPTTQTTHTTHTTYTTPTTHTTATTYSTRPTLSTASTLPTRTFPSDPKDKKPKSKKSKNDDKKAKKKKCEDLFNKCQEWKDKKRICHSPMFKPYMEFGCARSCSLCSASDEDPNMSSLQDDDSVNVLVGDKKSLLAVNPKTKDIDSRLNDVVEIGISREMIAANKNHGKNGHHLANSLHSKRRKSSRSKIPLKKYISKMKENPSAARRVEIEDGFKTDPNPFSSLKEVANGVDKVDLQTAVQGSEAEFKSNSFDALDRDLPDFGGLDNVGDVEKLLEAPKPKKTKLDYYMDHFSSDPYEAESEKEQWLQENDIRANKQYRREVKDTDRKGKPSSISQRSSVTSNTKSISPPQQLKRKQNESVKQKPNTKRVEIEDGFKSQQNPLTNFGGLSHAFSKVDSTSLDFGSKVNDALSDEGFGGKSIEVDSLNKLPDFDGLNNRKDVQELFETPTNKKFDYYVEHFSSDPYLAESEKQEWMKENDARFEKQFRRRLEDPKMAQNVHHKNAKTK